MMKMNYIKSKKKIAKEIAPKKEKSPALPKTLILPLK
jgi:hypothetical protein